MKISITYPSKLAFPGIDEIPTLEAPVPSPVFVYNEIIEDISITKYQIIR